MLAWGNWTSRPSPPECAAQGLRASRGDGAPSLERSQSQKPWCDSPVLRASGEDCRPGREDCPRSWGTSASPPLTSVCSVRWKPPHSNLRGPIRARRARQFKCALQRGFSAGLRDPALGAGEPAASVTVEQHRRLGLQAHPPGPERGGHGALSAPRLSGEPACPPGLVLLPHHLW